MLPILLSPPKKISSRCQDERHPFEGIGALSAGASSRLLQDGTFDRKTLLHTSRFHTPFLKLPKWWYVGHEFHVFFSKSGENFQKVLLLGMFVGACRTIPKLNGQRSWTCSSSHSPPPQWEGPPSRLGGEGHGARMTQVWCFLASSQGWDWWWYTAIELSGSCFSVWCSQFFQSCPAVRFFHEEWWFICLSWRAELKHT